MHFTRKKGLEIREESGAKMWRLLKRYIFLSCSFMCYNLYLWFPGSYIFSMDNNCFIQYYSFSSSCCSSKMLHLYLEILIRTSFCGFVCYQKSSMQMFFDLQELLFLEDDVKALEEMYPQGEKVMYEENLVFTTNLCLVCLAYNSFPFFQACLRRKMWKWER